MKLSLAIAALSLLARSTTAWNPLTSNPSLSSSNVISNNLADLTSDLSHDPSAQTLTFTHPDFQGHSLEIKAHDKNWCDPDAKSFSGYINTGHGRNLFFTFFESRNKPEDDPVVLWINGGPGCSSMLGMLMELGPCTISDPTNINGTTPNPHSWNNNANLIFLEEPLGVSFSFGNHGQTTSTTEEAAVDVQAFISIFFETFKSYRGREFYLAGESYGGRYLPVFASAVVDGNPILKSKGLTPINLKGVLIGNGITDAYAAQEAYYSYQCLPLPGLPHTPLQPIAKCVQMRKALPYCQEMLQKECIGRFDKTACGAAFAFCGSQFSESFFELGLNP
jgi:cathepsin A (carboxypeptidase C)